MKQPLWLVLHGDLKIRSEALSLAFSWEPATYGTGHLDDVLLATQNGTFAFWAIWSLSLRPVISLLNNLSDSSILSFVAHYRWWAGTSSSANSGCLLNLAAAKQEGRQDWDLLRTGPLMHWDTRVRDTYIPNFCGSQEAHITAWIWAKCLWYICSACGIYPLLDMWVHYT